MGEWVMGRITGRDKNPESPLHFDYFAWRVLMYCERFEIFCCKLHNIAA